MLRSRPIAASLLTAALLLAPDARAACPEDGLAEGTGLAELTTPLGRICIELLTDDAPLHVANFRHYVETQEMVGTIFHRSVPGFIVQGGGFIVAGDGFEAIPATNGTVQNEPCTRDVPDPDGSGNLVCSERGNVRGTLALAKIGGDPDSGSTNWFFNLEDNRANLDNQNGGFTVFGRVLEEDMAVVDAIAAQPRLTNDYGVWLDIDRRTTVAQWPISAGDWPFVPVAGDGCWDPNAQTTALDEDRWPSLIGLPDPEQDLFPIPILYTLSEACATPVAEEDVPAFVGNPDPGTPGGCLEPPATVYDVLTVGTTGPSTTIPDGTYWALTCEAQRQTLVDRASWQVALNDAFANQLGDLAVTIDAAALQTVPEPGLGARAAALAMLAALARRRASSVRRQR